MDVREFDDRMVCDQQDHPTFLVELWSWRYSERGEERGMEMGAHILNGCDVREALTWAQENQSEPGCFVLFAGTWTNCGFLKTLWLTGEPPGKEQLGDIVTFEI